MKSTTGKVLASVALVGTAAAVAGLGTYGAFTSTTTAEQKVTAGDVEIGLTDPGTLTVAVEKLLPGDSVEKFATLKNIGDSGLNTVALTTAAVTPSLLTTDATDGLQLAIEACSVAWTVVDSGVDTCSTGKVTVLGSNSIIMGGVSLTGLASLNPGGTDHLKITTALPSSATNAFQGLSSNIKFTFDATQRTGTVK